VPAAGTYGAIGFDPAVAALFGQRPEQLQDIGIAAFAEQANGDRRKRRRRSNRCCPARAPSADAHLDLGIGFRSQRLFEQGQHLGVGARRQFLRRLPADFAVAGEKTQRGECRSEFATQAVVDADRFGHFRRRHDLGIGRRVDHPLAIDDHHAFAGQRQRALGHGLEHRQRLALRAIDQRRDGDDLGVVAVGRQRAEQRRVDRRVRACNAQQPASND
jgi:hypothetical protein